MSAPSAPPSDGGPEVNHSGFCLSHPAIQIRKRRRNGGWMTLLSACPLCQIRDDEEASLSARGPGPRRPARPDSHLRGSDRSDGSGGTASDLSDLSSSSPTMGPGRRPGASPDGSPSRYTHPKHAGRKRLQPVQPPRPPPQTERTTTFLEPRRTARAATATTTTTTTTTAAAAAATATATTAAADAAQARRGRIPKCAAFDYSISDLEPSTRGRGGRVAHGGSPYGPERETPPPPKSPSRTCESADARRRRKLINLLDHHDGGCQSADWRGRRKTLSELDGADLRRGARAREEVAVGHEDSDEENESGNMARTASLSRLVHGRRARLDELRVRREGAPTPPPPPPPPPPPRGAGRSSHSASTRRADNTRRGRPPPPPRPPSALYAPDDGASVTSDLTGSTAVRPVPGSLDVSYDSFLRGGADPDPPGPGPAGRLSSIADGEDDDGSEASEDLSLTSRWEEAGSAVEVTEHRLGRRLRRVSSTGAIAGGRSDEAILDESNYTFATEESEEKGRAEDAAAVEESGCPPEGSDEEASCCGSISLSSSGSEAPPFGGDGDGPVGEEQRGSLSSTEAQAPGRPCSSATRSCRDPSPGREPGRYRRRHSQGSGCVLPSDRTPPPAPPPRSSSCSPNLRGILRKAFGGTGDGGPRECWDDDGTAATEAITEPSTASASAASSASRRSPPRGILRPSSHLRSSAVSTSSTVSSLHDDCSESTASTDVYSYPSTDWSESSSCPGGGSGRGAHHPAGILRRGGSRCSGRSAGTSRSGGSRVCFAGRDDIILDKLVTFCERDDDHYA